jgi:hypothetical protein
MRLSTINSQLSILLAAACCLLSSCHHETELEKVVRQANKKCPIIITDGMRLDSITISNQAIEQSSNQALTYYVTMFGIYEEEWMKDVVEANLAGLDDRQVSALLTQGLKDDPQFEKLLQESDCDLSLVLQYSDGRQAKTFDISTQEFDQSGEQELTMDIIRRDVQNSNAACPMEIAQGITMQSVTLDDEETAVTYVFRIGGEGITPESVDRSLLEGLQASISADLETNPAMRIYRDNGISIKYIFENEDGVELYSFEF